MAEWEWKPHPKGSTDSHRQSDRAKVFTPQGSGKGNRGKAVSGFYPDAIDKEKRWQKEQTERTKYSKIKSGRKDTVKSDKMR